MPDDNVRDDTTPQAEYIRIPDPSGSPDDFLVEAWEEYAEEVEAGTLDQTSVNDYAERLRRDAFFAWQNAEFIRSYLEAIYADVQRTLDGIRAVAQRDAAAKKRRALQEHQTQVQAYQRRTPGGKTVKVKSHKRRVMKRPPIPKYKAISDE